MAASTGSSRPEPYLNLPDEKILQYKSSYLYITV